MKNLKRGILMLIAATVMFTATGCYGTFELTSKIYDWNGDATDNKWANSIIMWGLIIIPVYEFCLFVDVVVLNTVEFWTGSNPLAMADGENDTQIVQSGDKVFEITASQNKFHIEQIEGDGKGQSIDLNYKAEETAWYVANGEAEYKFAQGELNNNELVKLFSPDGTVKEIALN
jgi:hypothetical protein